MYTIKKVFWGLRLTGGGDETPGLTPSRESSTRTVGESVDEETRRLNLGSMRVAGGPEQRYD